MGKKSKRSNNNNKQRRGGGGGGCGSDGTMPEPIGRRLQDLLQFLCVVALPIMEESGKASSGFTYRPYEWVQSYHDTGDPIQLWEIVMMIFVSENIDLLANQVERGLHDAIFRQTFGSSLLESDRREINSWTTMHVHDDFFIVDHRDDGAVFVQVGRLGDKECCKGNDDLNPNPDYHEPRVFLVQGLANPISAHASHGAESFKIIQPSLAEAYPNICLVRTTLLPYHGRIACMGPLTAFNKSDYYRSAKDWADATRVAVEAAKAAFNTTTDGAGNNNNSVPLYRTLNSTTDYHLSRLASEPLNRQRNEMLALRITAFQEGPRQSFDGSNCTRMTPDEVHWLPFMDRNHPKYMEYMEYVCNGKRPFRHSGARANVVTEMMVFDDDECPFHREFGKDGMTKSFKECCKEDFLKRRHKAKTKGNGCYKQIMYEPFERPEAELILEATREDLHNGDAAQPLDIYEFLRIGYLEVGSVHLTIDQEYLAELKHRMDASPIFHADLEYFWIYLGYFPARTRTNAIMAFGDINLNPTTGIFSGTATTSRRLTNLIREMKNVCAGIPILDASLCVRPAHKIKPDKEAMKKNEQLLREGLDHLSISPALVDTKTCDVVCCAYCDKFDGLTMSRCVCKAAYYCCKDHQRAHWGDHKAECKRIRGITGD